jgi:A/G-specific adenine glycosylase
MSSVFGPRLLDWLHTHPRPLPWDDGPRDAYHIWISEIVFQQTRIEQGGPYYRRFVAQFPDVFSLARTPLDDVLRAWEGLGYYSRARNLHKAAQIIVHEFDGRFPETYPGLLALPGVGPYTAAAIASFAYGLPCPVVDGNVKRVIARYAGVTDSVDTPTGHRLIHDLAAAFMGGLPPGLFNQAIMNFGALVCRPKNPLCMDCPLAGECLAFTQGRVDRLPVRTPKNPLRLRHLHFIVLRHQGKILLAERTGRDVWHGLYAPPAIETVSERIPPISAVRRFVLPLVGHDSISRSGSSETIRQLLSHQDIAARFHVYDLEAPPATRGNGKWCGRTGVNKVAKPRLVNQWLGEYAW